MAEYVLTPDAKHDLAWLYREGRQRFGVHQADIYMDAIFHQFDLLYKSHVIVFEAVDNGVKILRVFYGGSDYLRYL